MATIGMVILKTWNLQIQIWEENNCHCLIDTSSIVQSLIDAPKFHRNLIYYFNDSGKYTLQLKLSNGNLYSSLEVSEAIEALEE